MTDTIPVNYDPFVMGEASKPPQRGFDLWHGSGKNFDKFDSIHDLTGEGSQVYGKGHYLAEEPEVARSYQNLVGKGAGTLYRVHVKADPEHFLHWDKPLSQQSPHVQQAIDKMTGPRENWGREWDEVTGGQLYNRMAGWQDNHKEAVEYMQHAGIPGIKYYDEGSRGKQSSFTVRHDLDKGEFYVSSPGLSKHAGPFKTREEGKEWIAQHEPKKTHNYVIFSDAITHILQKFGPDGLGIDTTNGLAHYKDAK